MAKTKALAKIPDPATPATLTASDQVKLTRLLIKAQKEEREIRAITELGRIILGSPIFQVAGTVLACEWMENKENPWISSGWATGIETGTIALVGLHVLKNYGFAGLGIAGTAGLTGSVLGSDIDAKAVRDKLQGIFAASGGNPASAVVNAINSILGSFFP